MSDDGRWPGDDTGADDTVDADTSLPATATKLGALTAAVGLLTQRVDRLEAHTQPTADGSAGSSGAWVWTSLSSDEAAMAWAALTGWVDLIVTRYGLHEAVPACWYAHPPMVEELSALRAAWLAAYHPQARTDQPVYWHDMLDRVLTRLRQWNRTGCARQHRAEPQAPPCAAGEARRRYIGADIAERGRALGRTVGEQRCAASPTSSTHGPSS